MDCKKVQNLITHFFENDLNKDQVEEMEKHIESCNECNAVFDEYQTVFENMNNSPVIAPSKNLKKGFLEMLENQKLELKHQSRPLVKWHNTIAFKIAASIMLLFGGYLVGNKTGVSDSETAYHKELTTIKDDIQIMKQAVLVSKFRKESASERIKAVNQTSEIMQPDSLVINALLSTLNTDQNTNVRLAAANALGRFRNSSNVRNGLIESLENQKSPTLQIELITILTSMEEKKAIRSFERLVNDQDTYDMVRDQAKMGIAVML